MSQAFGRVIGLLFVVAGCDHPRPKPDAAAPVDAVASVDAAGEASFDSATPIEAAAPSAPRTCALTRTEAGPLEACAYSLVSMMLGQRGAFTVRVEMSGHGLPRTRVEGYRWVEARSGDRCDAAARALAAHLPCTWDVRGPFPAWTVHVVSSE